MLNSAIELPANRQQLALFEDGGLGET